MAYGPGGIALVAFTYPAYTVLRLVGSLGLGVWILEAFYLDGTHVVAVGFWLGLICGLVPA